MCPQCPQPVCLHRRPRVARLAAGRLASAVWPGCGPPSRALRGDCARLSGFREALERRGCVARLQDIQREPAVRDAPRLRAVFLKWSRLARLYLCFHTGLRELRESGVGSKSACARKHCIGPVVRATSCAAARNHAFPAHNLSHTLRQLPCRTCSGPHPRPRSHASESSGPLGTGSRRPTVSMDGTPAQHSSRGNSTLTPIILRRRQADDARAQPHNRATKPCEY